MKNVFSHLLVLFSLSIGLAHAQTANGGSWVSSYYVSPGSAGNTTKILSALRTPSGALFGASSTSTRNSNFSNQLASSSFMVTADTLLSGIDLGAGSVFFGNALNTGTAPNVTYANQYLADNAAGANDIYLTDGSAARTDGTSQLQYTGTTSATMLLQRYSASVKTGYSGRYNSAAGQLEIGRWNAGVYTVIAGKAISAPSGSFVLTFNVSGTSLSLFITGSVSDSVTTTDVNFTSGYSGLRFGNTSDGKIWFYSDSARPVSYLATNVASAGTDWYGWMVSGSSYVETQNTGDSFNLAFTGPYCVLSVNCPLGITGYIGVTFDYGTTWRLIRVQGGGSYGVTIYSSPNDTSRKQCTVCLLGNDSVTDNWLTPVNGFVVSGISTDPSYGPVQASVLATKWVVIGDSISRGRALTAGAYKQYGTAFNAWPWLVAAQNNARMDFIAFSGQGGGTAGPGNVPAAMTAVNSFFSGVARPVDTSVSRVYVAHGTNDAGLSEAATMADMTTLWTNVRILYPNAKIVVVLPLGYSGNTSVPTALAFRDTHNTWIQAAFAAWADPNSQLIDLTAQVYGNSMLGPLGGGSNIYTNDLIHPNEMTNVLIAAYISSQ